MTARTFRLIRDVDVSGISGTGIIAEGVIFSDGQVSLHWVNTPYPTTTLHPQGLDSVMYVHGHGGKTRLVWDDDLPEPSFNEDDVVFLHDILSMPSEVVSHGRARILLSKIRAAMKSIPHQNSIP